MHRSKSVPWSKPGSQKVNNLKKNVTTFYDLNFVFIGIGGCLTANFPTCNIEIQSSKYICTIIVLTVTVCERIRYPVDNAITNLLCELIALNDSDTPLSQRVYSSHSLPHCNDPMYRGRTHFQKQPSGCFS